MPTPQTYAVDFEPVGRRVEITPGQSLLEAAQAAGVEIVSLCGGIGSCDSCRVQRVEGALSPPTLVEEGEFPAEALAAGWRLACQAQPLGDVKVHVPPESLTTPQRLQLEGQAAQFTLDPSVVPLDVTLAPAALTDLRDDLTRLRDAVADQVTEPLTADLAVLGMLSGQLRQQEWRARLAVREGSRLVALLPPETPLLGLAVDIGTTSLAAYLMDLTSGAMLARQGAMNPQIAYGEDVISRIAYINNHAQGKAELQQGVVKTINTLVEAMCAEAGASTAHIVEAVVVGNTAMHHIFAGLPVQQLGESPYVPAVGPALTFPAREVGLNLAPGALVYLPPCIGGYVGADHVAMLLAAGVPDTTQTTLAIDVGTNTELTLAAGGTFTCCSCASGPAFEGAHIHDGMRAAPGAIERVQWLDGRVRVQTIGAQAPVGICGSGILDAVAVMAEVAAVDPRGALRLDHPQVRTGNGKPAFVLAPADQTAHGRDVLVTRRDVSEIQLAKGAIRAGIEIVLQKRGLTAQDVDAFIIAGAFGSYINVPSALRVGMFPQVPLGRFQQVGNAAGMGAVQLLLSAALRRRVEALVPQIEYVELTLHQGFQDEFMKYMAL